MSTRVLPKDSSGIYEKTRTRVPLTKLKILMGAIGRPILMGYWRTRISNRFFDYCERCQRASTAIEIAMDDNHYGMTMDQMENEPWDT